MTIHDVYSRHPNSVLVEKKKTTHVGQHDFSRGWYCHPILSPPGVSRAWSHQVLEVGRVLNPDDPQLQDLLLQLHKVGGEVLLSCTFIQAHTFSMGLRSGLLSGHLMSSPMGFPANQTFTTFDLWHRALSWRKCVVPYWFMKKSSLSLRSCLYLVPFIISPGLRNSRPPLPL